MFSEWKCIYISKAITDEFLNVKFRVQKQTQDFIYTNYQLCTYSHAFWNIVPWYGIQNEGTHFAREVNEFNQDGGGGSCPFLTSDENLYCQNRNEMCSNELL